MLERPYRDLLINQRNAIDTTRRPGTAPLAVAESRQQAQVLAVIEALDNLADAVRNAGRNPEAW